MMLSGRRAVSSGSAPRRETPAARIGVSGRRRHGLIIEIAFQSGDLLGGRRRRKSTRWRLSRGCHGGLGCDWWAVRPTQGSIAVMRHDVVVVTTVGRHCGSDGSDGGGGRGSRMAIESAAVEIGGLFGGAVENAAVAIGAATTAGDAMGGGGVVIAVVGGSAGGFMRIGGAVVG